MSDHRFLGGAGRWRDSGMHGTPPNEHPRAFWQADREEAVLALVTILRETRPQVVITYDARGGYGHPDHIQAHRITVEAVRCAGDPTYAPEAGPAWTVSKLYWTAVPVSVLQDGVEQVRAAGRFTAVASAADLAFGNPDDEVTTAIDAAAYLPAKLAAMRAHATQISVDEPYFALSDHVGHVARGTEHYVLRDGVITERETDLFGGVDTSLDTPNG